MKNFKHKKSLGQNFLNSDIIINKIVNIIPLTNKDLVIEIGPGSGALTKELVKKPSKLICFELDKRLSSVLSEYESDKCQIIYEDFLQISLNDYIKENYANIYVIANLPYYITTPIIEHIISSSIQVNKLVIMVQKEVALRLTAVPKTKDYGYISAYLDYFYERIIELDVPRKNFTPIPNVDSAVISLTKKNDYKCDEVKLKALLKNSFAHKRKNLKNNLLLYNNITDIEKELKKNGFSLQNRAEEIPISIYVEIVNKCI